MRLLVAALLVAPAILSGCIFTPGQDDLTDVCESKAGAPGPAYTVDGIVAYTRVLDANLTASHARKLLTAVQPDVITLGQHAHPNFTATLAPTESGWRFDGAGLAANGTVLDTYRFALSEDTAGVTVEALSPVVGAVQAPQSMVSAAWRLVNATPDLASVATKTPTLVATGWNPVTPTCVRLLFQDGPADAIQPASAEHPHTTAVVSFASNRVVLIKHEP